MSDSSALKIVFAGTPDFAAVHLAALLRSQHQVCAVFTQPDRPAGRGKKVLPSPVKQLALAHHIDVQQPLSLKSAEAQASLMALGADVLIVVAYGLLLPQAILDIPRLGCLNVHASLLPRWRGAAPIQRAIEAGDPCTGITIMQMDKGLDTGAMLKVSECPIAADDTAATLHDRLAALGPPVLLATLAEIAAGTQSATAQDNSLATYAAKLTKDEAQIDWREPAGLVVRRIRAFNPFPVAFTDLGDIRLRIFAARALPQTHNTTPGQLLHAGSSLEVACGNGSVLAIDQLQMPGKRVLASRDLVNGTGTLFTPGVRLGHH